jgi:hypothetical protein
MDASAPLAAVVADHRRQVVQECRGDAAAVASPEGLPVPAIKEITAGQVQRVQVPAVAAPQEQVQLESTVALAVLEEQVLRRPSITFRPHEVVAAEVEVQRQARQAMVEALVV